MILTSVFILAFSWYIARGIMNNSSAFAIKARNLKPQVEMVIPVKILAEADDKTLYLEKYLEEKREEEEKDEKGKIQKIKLKLMPDSLPSEFYLN